jgi:hypothetical protein
MWENLVLSLSFPISRRISGSAGPKFADDTLMPQRPFVLVQWLVGTMLSLYRSGPHIFGADN